MTIEILLDNKSYQSKILFSYFIKNAPNNI
jgi:hypothetical protein